MIVGGYSLHLYCDSGLKPAGNVEGHGWAGEANPAEFAGRNKTACRTQAKARGWILQGTLAICPVCAVQWRVRGKTPL